ncbi:MAG: tripartite tricarboxylate transporter substrate binding protein [Proteobacteria bacterium]|nr:tripartite tricarboxylate transporter substrate binding protein [Pseudomonadota bacterium]
MNSFRLLLSLLLSFCVAPAAFAQAYPTKPIKLIVGYSPGGAVDIIARTIGQKLSASLGQPVLVDNKPGAGTNIAVRSLIDSPADGYTLMMTANAISANASLYQPPPFDPDRDVAPVSLVGKVPVVIATTATSPYSSLSKLISAAKSAPGTINYATPGNGSTPHLAVELFARAAGVSLTHIPYRGGAPAIVDVIGGQVPLVAVNALEALPHHNSGKLHVIAAMSTSRSSILPGVPTIAESGYAGFEASVWYGLIAPAATPKAIIVKLHAEVQKALASAEVKERMNSVGGEVLPTTAEKFGELIHSERVRYEKLIREANLKPS